MTGRALRTMVVVALLALPGIHAITWDDDTHDVVVEYRAGAGQAAAVDNGDDWYERYDIASLEIHEIEDELVFIITPRTQEGDRDPEPVSHVDSWVHFTFDGVPRAIQSTWWYADEATPAFGLLLHQAADRWVRDANLLVSPSSTGWSIHLNKWDLRSTDHIPARAGDVLEDIWLDHRRLDDRDGTLMGPGCWVTPSGAVRVPGSGCGMYPSDTLGTPESPAGSYTIQESAGGLQDLLIESDTPLRVSNGLATTYRFDVLVRNIGDQPLGVAFQADNVPQGWSVEPPSQLTLPGGGDILVHVLVDVPFRHEHGASETFDLVAQDHDKPQQRASTTLGVYWTPIPQPGGHHPTLFIHGSDDGGGWLNTMSEDPSSNGRGAHTTDSLSSAVAIGADGPHAFGEQLRWTLPLRPGLAMGLNGEVGAPVEFEIALASYYEITEVHGTVTLEYVGNKTIELASGSFGPITMGPGGTVVRVTAPWPVEADLLSFTEDANLLLKVMAAGPAHPGQFVVEQAETEEGFSWGSLERQPYLMTQGSRITLPLLDHHDLLGGDIATADDIQEARNQDPAEAKSTAGPLGVGIVLAAALWRRR